MNPNLVPEDAIMYAYVILASAVAGVLINLGALVMIIRRQSRGCAAHSMFHDLLKILMAYDVFVVICCALHFAMPKVIQVQQCTSF